MHIVTPMQRGLNPLYAAVLDVYGTIVLEGLPHVLHDYREPKQGRRQRQ